MVVLDCGGVGGMDVPSGVRAVSCRVLGVVQSFLADERFARARLVVVTRGAVAVARDAAGVVDVVQAPVWGLVRAAAAENPGRFVLVDVEAGADLGEAGFAVGSGEPESAVRAGVVWVPRLVRLPVVAGG
ncbi:SpnB-like Rossmann fold domain-containing protein, partial [Streptomyces sp. PTD9-10]|uniref:SpnB-like Rossmann fold domain-containing protein n=1 Tax=Streptomyces sp. PTD9-10 TaxID=3120151 RepID=UPI00300AE99C